MKLRKPNQNGFHVLPVLVVVVVISAIGFAGWKVMTGGDKENKPTATPVAHTDSNNEPVRWAFNHETLKWYTQTGKAPTCEEPFHFDRTPADLSKMMTIGMPGAYRGYSYKPHGGMRLSNPNSGKTEVRMPADATLVALTRYYEGTYDDIQYLLTFETDCGIAFRFDHLHQLSPELQKIADTTPEPKRNDTRSDPNRPFPRTQFKTGDLVATEVGFPSIKNFGFDFGAYDYRKPNQISKNKEWAALHNQYHSLEWYGVCWVDMLPQADVAKAKELAFVVINPRRPNIISDYCTYAPYKTLDFNDGKPTDG